MHFLKSYYDTEGPVGLPIKGVQANACRSPVVGRTRIWITSWTDN